MPLISQHKRKKRELRKEREWARRSWNQGKDITTIIFRVGYIYCADLGRGAVAEKRKPDTDCEWMRERKWWMERVARQKIGAQQLIHPSTSFPTLKYIGSSGSFFLVIFLIPYSILYTIIINRMLLVKVHFPFYRKMLVCSPIGKKCQTYSYCLVCCSNILP